MRHRALILTALLVCLPGPGHADPAFRVVAWDKLSEDWITLSQHSDREEAGKATVAELNRGEYTMVRMVPDARGGLELSEKVIDDNDFTVNRDFKKYKAYLGRRFAADYKKWRKGMRVLDAGAGQAMLFRTLRDELGDDAPEMVAVGARKPIDEPRGSFAFDRVPIDYTGIAYHEGFLGADGEIEKALGVGEYDRIVDVYGASHYAPRLDQIIESYGKLLKPGGKAFLHVSEKIRLFVHNESGERIGIVEYLGAIEGMRVSDVRPNKRGGHSLTLTRTRERLRVPALEPKDFIYIEDLAPPIRKYRFKGGKTVINGRKRATMRRMRDKRSAPVTRQRRRVPRLRRSGPRR